MQRLNRTFKNDSTNSRQLLRLTFSDDDVIHLLPGEQYTVPDEIVDEETGRRFKVNFRVVKHEMVLKGTKQEVQVNKKPMYRNNRYQ